MTPNDPTRRLFVPPVQSPFAPPAIPIVQPPSQGMDQAAMAPTPMPVAPTQPLPQAPPIVSAPPSPNQAELARLQGSKPGVDQIKNPVLKTLAKIGDVAGSLFPMQESLIPGTTLHHDVLVKQAARNVAQEEADKEKEAQIGLQGAEAKKNEALGEVAPELADIRRETAANTRAIGERKADIAEQGVTQKGTEADAKIRQKMQLAGLDPDTGEALPDEKLPPAILAKRDLDSAHEDYFQANSQLAQARATNQPQLIALAQRRVATAANNAEIATQRLALANKTYNARYLGTGENGEALPGAMLTDDNTPVGSTFSANVRPTSGEINKADLANSAVSRVHEMRDIINRRPDLFGPGNGRVSKVEAAIGNNDPDAQKYQAAATYLADHSAALFGGRSKYVSEQLHGLNDPHFNVDSLKSALDEAETTAAPFAKVGTRRTAGSAAAREATPAPTNGPKTANDYLKSIGHPAGQ